MNGCPSSVARVTARWARSSAVREASQPQNECSAHVARDAWVRSKLEAVGAVALRLEALDAVLEVLEAAVDVVGERQARADHEMPVDADALIALGVGEAQDFPAQLERLVELSPVDVHNGECSENREELGDFALSLEELQRPIELLLDLVREPVLGHHRPRQACPQREFLDRALTRRRCGREHAQHLPRQLDVSLVAALRLVHEPEAVDELVELVVVALARPVAPGEAQVLGVGGQRGQHGLTAVGRHTLPLPAREVREVRGVGTTRGGTELRTVPEALGCVLPDRRQHHQPQIPAVRIALSHQALVDERCEAVERVDLRSAVPVDTGCDGFHRFHRGAREGGEQLEKPLLARFE